MYIGEIKTADCANGLGMRVTIFVSGCTNCCKGCFQPETWDFCYGEEWTKEKQDFVIKELSLPYYAGLTILGGEPFEPQNQEEVLKFIKRIKKELPEKNIWVFTGCVYDKDLIKGGRRYTTFTDEILDNIDVLVDGPFIEEKKNLSLRFRGSSNQRLIDMKKTRKLGKVTLIPLEDRKYK